MLSPEQKTLKKYLKKITKLMKPVPKALNPFWLKGTLLCMYSGAQIKEEELSDTAIYVIRAFNEIMREQYKEAYKHSRKMIYQDSKLTTYLPSEEDAILFGFLRLVTYVLLREGVISKEQFSAFGKEVCDVILDKKRMKDINKIAWL